jgi:hypothetical protein
MCLGVKSGKNANFIKAQVCKIELAILGEVAHNKAMVDTINLENHIMTTNVNKH